MSPRIYDLFMYPLVYITYCAVAASAQAGAAAPLTSKRIERLLEAKEMKCSPHRVCLSLICAMSAILERRRILRAGQVLTREEIVTAQRNKESFIHGYQLLTECTRQPPLIEEVIDGEKLTSSVYTSLNIL